MIFRFYGVRGVGNDFYIHITNSIIMSACLIRMNEVNLRNSFSLLSQSKIQEREWQRVLTMLTDGVLIMQHTDSDRGILLINPSLQKIFGRGNSNGILNGQQQQASQFSRKQSEAALGDGQPKSGGQCSSTTHL